MPQLFVCPNGLEREIAVEQLCDGIHVLVLLVIIWFRWRGVLGRDGLRLVMKSPRNLFRKVGEDFFNVWYHVKSDTSGGRKIDCHPNVFVAMASLGG